ncbi:predicted protein [Nematostella vectensis]|uniref:Uncharacterized protein n=1 Tax=Nematostella vectensis TaxID=45351 RepID=A7S5M7_NEMVE|nr:predicted protein [Nematostella vectensis]|eukprot:XP_001633066.1 predicted protein [Nematostella vectensis]
MLAKLNQGASGSLCSQRRIEMKRKIGPSRSLKMFKSFAKRMLLIGLIFGACYSEVNSVKCYMCFSRTSFEDCDNNLEIHDCSTIPGRYTYDTCQSIYIVRRLNATTNLYTYRRACAQKRQCELTIKRCESLNMYCENECCYDNLCNDARKLLGLVSVIVVSLLIVSMLVYQ